MRQKYIEALGIKKTIKISGLMEFLVGLDIF
jgi:hypothetical protein